MSYSITSDPPLTALEHRAVEEEISLGISMFESLYAAALELDGASIPATDPKARRGEIAD